MSEIDRAMLQSMAASFRGALEFSFNRHDMAELMDRCASRTDIAPTLHSPEYMAERQAALIGWLRNPWAKCDNQARGPIPEWCHALMFEAANVIESLIIQVSADISTPAADTRVVAVALLDRAMKTTMSGIVRDEIRAIIDTATPAPSDKPAPAATVQEAILEVWGCCEELEDEALAKLSGVKTEHEKGFWAGQKMTAKRIRRATQMPIAGGGDE